MLCQEPGTTRTLAISNISVSNGETVSVTITSPAGFTITGSPQTAVVYKSPVVISLAAISGVVIPVIGATPVTTAINTDQYTGTIAWSPVDNPFAASTEYTANIVLIAKYGFTLTGVTANFFTVAGATATNSANSGNISAKFHRTQCYGDGDAMENAINLSSGTYTYDTTGFTNDYTFGSSTSFGKNMIAPDMLFIIDVPTGKRLIVTANPSSDFDIAIALLSNPSATDVAGNCLKCADDLSVGGTETVIYNNSGALLMQVYLVVDGYTLNDFGIFNLTIDIN